MKKAGFSHGETENIGGKLAARGICSTPSVPRQNYPGQERYMDVPSAGTKDEILVNPLLGYKFTKAHSLFKRAVKNGPFE
jgi:hypothetical protein